MILNPKSSSFYFIFPKGFFPEIVVDKYLPYLKKQPIPFDNVANYMNSTIRSIGFPSMSIDSVEQVRPLGKKINYKSGTPIQDLFSKDFSIQFKLVDGFINYFIMLDTVIHFMDFQNPGLFLQNLPLRIMDNEGNIITSVTFKEVTLTSFSELELAYTSNSPQPSSFTVGFKCNYLDIVLEAK
jgi:hypothetical protein